MIKLRSYLLVAVLVYLITLLAFLPASIAVKPLEQSLGDRFRVTASTGTFWAGRAVFNLDSNKGELIWDIDIARLLMLQLAANVQFKAKPITTSFYLQYGLGGIVIKNLKGVFYARALSTLLEQNGVSASFDEDVYLQDIGLERANNRFSAAQGKLEWAGGVVRGKQLPDKQISLPAMDAQISSVDNGLSIKVHEKETARVLAEVDLSHEGQAHLKLRERLADYVSIPAQLKVGNPDNVMFEIKQQVFQSNGKF